MGIDIAAFEFLLRAHADGGAFGRTVTLGRQRLLMRDEAAERRYAAVLARYRPDLTVHDIRDENVDRMLEALGASPSHFLDNSAYEGAQVIHDLNEKLPDGLKGAYDTVIDIGTLEHVFNIGTGLKSMAEMVRPGGRFLCLNVADNHLGHGFWQFGPEAFFRTFSPANGFEPRSADLYHRGAFHPLRDPEAAGRRLPERTPGYAYITFTAKRLEDRPIFADGWPVQADYVAAWRTFLAQRMEREGDVEGAVGELRSAMADHPANPHYPAQMAAMMHRAGRLDEATDWIARAQAMVDDNPFVAAIAERVARAATPTPTPTPAPAPMPVSASTPVPDGDAGTVDVAGVRVLVEHPDMPANAADAMRSGRYEFKEREIARRLLVPGDRVMELGAGVGVVSCTLARLVGEEGRVVSYEANPALSELLAGNVRRNDAAVDIRHVIAVPRATYEPGATVPFYAFRSYAASSTREIRPGKAAIQIPTVPLEDEIDAIGATALIMDIEGGEEDVIDHGDLAAIRKLVMEVHPKISGEERVAGLIDALHHAGLACRADLMFGDVVGHERDADWTLDESPGAMFVRLRAFHEAVRADPARARELADALPPALLEGPRANGYVLRDLASAWATEDPERARDLVERAVAAGSGDFQLGIDLASIALREGDAGTARAHLDAVERAAPLTPALARLRAHPVLARA